MRHTFQTKLLAILGVATIAFASVIGLGAVLEQRTDDQLSRIAQLYIPKLELGPRLTRRFDELVRGFRDAVAAQDDEALRETRVLRDLLLTDLASAAAIVPQDDALALRTAVKEFHATALAVSQRMLAKETGESLLEAIDDMQSKQRSASALLAKATALDQTALTRAFAAATTAQETARRVRLTVSICCLSVVLILGLWLSRGVLRALREIGAGFRRFGRGDFDTPIGVLSKDEFGELAQQANEMAHSLKALNEQRDRSDWLTAGLSGLVHEVRGELSPEAIATRAARYLARYVSAPAAALYWLSPTGRLELLGHHGVSTPDQSAPSGVVEAGAGLLGQSALEQGITVVSDLPADYFPIRSALGASRPNAVVLVPLVRLGQVAGVLELAVFKPWTETNSELLLSVRESLAIAIEMSRARAALSSLLAETQAQATRLRAQEDELRSTNDELQQQQEVVLSANAVLKRQALELDSQRRSLELNNAELHEVRRTLEQKAHELSAVSAFKSQFLANMSHELRTPLNSMLILSSLLADHEAGVLTEKQTEFCSTIHGAAKDLLALINQVLDLAKVESGKQEVELETVRPSDLSDYARRLFEPLARDKQLAFTIEVDREHLPETIETDRRKVEQILNNLLGNAIKFTERGSVTLRIGPPDRNLPPQREELSGNQVIALSVSDTGAGIPAEHQARIFAPFEQLESAPDRRYGGSGLGLSIARELSTLLGGELCLKSQVGRGSTFVCHLPWQPRIARGIPHAAPQDAAAASAESAIAPRPLGPDAPPAQQVPATEPALPCRILVVEDEPEIAEAVLAQLQGDHYELIVARSAEQALEQLARQSFSCVVLDLGLPDIDGLELLEALHGQGRATLPPVLVHTGRTLSQTQRAWLTQHAEVVVLKQGVTVDRLVDEIRLFARRSKDGAPRRTSIATIVPAARCSLAGRKLLVADDDMRTVYALSALLRNRGIELLVADTGRAALQMLDQHPDVELVLMDIIMPEMDGYEATRQIRLDPRFARLPIVVLTANAMTSDRAKCLAAGATDYLLKPLDADLLFAVLSAHLTPTDPPQEALAGADEPRSAASR